MPNESGQSIISAGTLFATLLKPVEYTQLQIMPLFSADKREY